MEQQTMKIQDLTLIALMAALTCILGPMSITLPFTPVPISFTNLVIYFAVMVIGMKRGTISYLVYLLIGAVGLPVFSGFSGGLAKLAGPTGGYLVGFIFLALISGFFVVKILREHSDGSNWYGTWNSSNICIWNDLAVCTDAFNICTRIICRCDSISSRRCGKDRDRDHCRKCSEEGCCEGESFTRINNKYFV